MFHPLPLFVGLRYARARSNRYFVSFITWVSLAGVCVGVAALIVILSVMNGFESELRTRLLALSAPVRVTAAGTGQPDWAEVSRQTTALGGMRAVERYAELQGLAVGKLEMQPIVLRAAEGVTAAELQTLLVEGELAQMLQGEGVILGRLVAEQLGVNVGDQVTLMIPFVEASPGSGHSPWRACSRRASRITTARWSMRASIPWMRWARRAVVPRAWRCSWIPWLLLHSRSGCGCGWIHSGPDA
jgi:lipoprotein-releasing system permease protein